jgi:hypothetical protein
MKGSVFFIVVVFWLVVSSGCNTCKYVSKHPECFPTDTVYKNSEKIKYVEKISKQDSVKTDTVPCINDTAIVYRKVYISNTITKIDTIYSDKYVSKVNPVNTQLRKDYDKLKTKSDKHKAAKKLYLKIMIGLALICVILMWWLFR